VQNVVHRHALCDPALDHVRHERQLIRRRGTFLLGHADERDDVRAHMGGQVGQEQWVGMGAVVRDLVDDRGDHPLDQALAMPVELGEHPRAILLQDVHVTPDPRRREPRSPGCMPSPHRAGRGAGTCAGRLATELTARPRAVQTLGGVNPPVS
jgi:hypothetical protein